MSKKVSKLPFIDRSRLDNGVHVDIENQLVTIAVNPNAELNQAALFEAIVSGGYEPTEMFELTPDGERRVWQP